MTAPGDLILVERESFLSSMIRWGQNDPGYDWATHAGILISETELMEALGSGIVRSPISKYNGIRHAIVHFDMPDDVRTRVVEFALHGEGREYGYIEIVSLGVTVATRFKLHLSWDNQLICSAYAAESLSRNFIFPFEPLWAKPSDLAHFFDVKRPT